MSNHYLVVDDGRRAYFDCKKLLILGGEDDIGPPDALHDQPFDRWIRLVNWVLNDDEPLPAESTRYLLAEREGRALYDFLVASGWKARLISLDDDDFDRVFDWDDGEPRAEPAYTCIGRVY
jgi:hypothetical protein